MLQRSGNMTPQMIVLGLLAQEPGTVASVARRLADQFPAAEFPRNSAHTNLPSLAKQGRARLVREGQTPSHDFYEATTDGIAHLHEWVRRRSSPAIRDELQGKLEFVGLDDLAALLSAVQEDEKACRSACDLAHGELLTHRGLLHRLPKEEVGWRDRLHLVQLKDAAVMWGSRAERMALLGSRLKRVLDEAAPGEG